jgi:hypothetical protein
VPYRDLKNEFYFMDRIYVQLIKRLFIDDRYQRLEDFEHFLVKRIIID